MECECLLDAATNIFSGGKDRRVRIRSGGYEPILRYDTDDRGIENPCSLEKYSRPALSRIPRVRVSSYEDGAAFRLHSMFPASDAPSWTGAALP